MAKEMELDRAPIEFQTFYFSHVCVTPPTPHPLAELALGSTEKSAKKKWESLQNMAQKRYICLEFLTKAKTPKRKSKIYHAFRSSS